MSSSDNIQRLREKRKNIENTYSHSPKTKGSEIIAQDVDVNGNDISRNTSTRTSRVSNDSKGRNPTVSNDFSTSILEHIAYLEMKVKDLEGLKERLKEVEEKVKTPEKDATQKYPTDSYSLIALNGPQPTLLWYELWSDQGSFYFFLFGLLVFLFQIALYGTMLFGETDRRWGTVTDNGNPDWDIDFFAALVPANTNSIVKAAQIISLLVYIVFPDSTLQDLLGAYRYFPRCSCSNRDSDPVWMMRFACILKGLQAIFGIVTVWVLVMQSSSVTAIILNFMAVNFISDIDDRAFSLAKDGVFGLHLKAEASENIGATKLPTSMQRKNGGGFAIVLTSAGLLLLGFMIYVMRAQDNPEIWLTQNLQVNFNDEAFKNYTGCLFLDERSKHFNRYTYNGFSSISLTYCGNDRKWYLLEDSDDSDISDPCSAWYDVGIASSSETESFDVSAAFGDTWTSFAGKPLDIKFDGSCTIDGGGLMISGLTTDGGTSGLTTGGSVAGNGICDDDLNTPKFQYDGGDCCAATCKGPRCGKKVLPSAFGTEANATVAGFPNCRDPEMMRRMTVQLRSSSGK